MNTAAIEQYKKINKNVNLDEKNSYKIIQMLLAGALEKIALAKIELKKENLPEKCKNISLAITIIDGLQLSLDQEQGGKIAEDLFKLYNYSMERLLIANLKNDLEILNEVESLLQTIKDGWDGIEQEAIEILKDKAKEGG